MAIRITKNTSKNFRTIQTMLNLNDRQLADRLGVEVTTIARYNDGYGRNKVVPKATFNRMVQELLA